MNAIPSATHVDLTLEHLGTTLALRDLLTLFTAFTLDNRQAGSTLRLRVGRLRLAHIKDIKGVGGGSCGDSLGQMFKDGGRITYLRGEFDGEVRLEVGESQARLAVELGGIQMEVLIQGEAVNGN